MSNDQRKCWAANVLEELNKGTDLKKDTFVLLAGKLYLKFIKKELVNKDEPLKGLSIGKRISRLKELTTVRE